MMSPKFIAANEIDGFLKPTYEVVRGILGSYIELGKDTIRLHGST